MSAEMIGLWASLGLAGLMLLRVPIGIAMMIAGALGYAAVVGPSAAIGILSTSPLRNVTEYNLLMVSLFILMGSFASASGLSRELFAASNAFLGHRRGGLASATIFASAGFAAICGSSVASAATMSRIALPEMRRAGYRDAISTGTIAAGGTLGILIPPSLVLAIYGILTEQDIRTLFIAGILPGGLAVALYLLTIGLIGLVNPESMPAAGRTPWRERFRAMRGLWAVILLFVLVIGGMYGSFGLKGEGDALFTPSEAAAVGAAGTLLIGVVRRRLTLSMIVACFVDSMRTSASIFTILLGALVFGYFLTITQLPQTFTETLAGLPVGRYGILALVLLTYLILGCFLDAFAMIVLTVPVVVPLLDSLGFDLVWFGVILVMVVEIALLSPPVGMNVFVIKAVHPDLTLKTIFSGAGPFLAMDCVRLAILCIWPQIILFLPQQLG